MKLTLDTGPNRQSTWHDTVKWCVGCIIAVAITAILVFGPGSLHIDAHHDQTQVHVAIDGQSQATDTAATDD